MNNKNLLYSSTNSMVTIHVHRDLQGSPCLEQGAQGQKVKGFRKTI